MGTLQKHDVKLVSTVPILGDFSVDLSSSIQEPIGAEIELHVGIHRAERLAEFMGAQRPGLLVGMQTEHIYDHGGNLLWKAHLHEKILKQLAKYDAVVDLSYANVKAYAEIPADLRERIYFGPHIFPTSVPAVSITRDGPAVFVGGLNRRRNRKLSEFADNSFKVLKVDPNTYGDQLKLEMAKGSSIINIHFANGVYAEAPRILKALLAGKPVISEELGPPFIPGLHYIPLPNTNSSSEILQSCYKSMGSLLCTDYSLTGILRTIARTKGHLLQ